MSTSLTHIEKKKSLVSQLRFKEFDEDWRIESLTKLYTNIVVGFVGTISNDYCNQEIGVQFIRTLNVKNGWFSNEGLQYVTKEFHQKNKKSQVKNGDILIARVGANMGLVCEITGIVGEANSANVIVIKEQQNLSSSFYASYLTSPKGQKQIQSKGAGGAQEVLNISVAKTIKVPLLPHPEQQKIASFLSAVDQKIQQLSRKKELLEQYKKGVMQQLFSGKLRFKDENGKSFQKWDEKELNDLCEIARSGGTPQSTKKEFYDGNIPFLSISDMTSQGKYLKYTSNHISKLGLDNSASWIVPANSIIYSMYASVGFVAINKIPMATSQAVLNLILKKNINIEFTYYTLIDFQKRVSKFITTGTQGNLNAQTVKGFKISLPCLEEQEKIANYLSNIDNKIESVTKQITQTQTFKKGLLQQMFV